MAERAQHKVAQSTLYKALHRDDLPDMPVVLAIVTGCGTGDREIFVTRLAPDQDRPPGRPAARLWVVPASSPQ
jgi:hypothetical protein